MARHSSSRSARGHRVRRGLLTAVVTALALNVAAPSLADDGFDAALRRGAAALESGDATAAADDFTAALALRPKSPVASFGLGAARYRLKDWSGARAAFLAAGEAGGPALAADATFNLGTTAYAEALGLLEALAQKAEGGAAPGPAPANGEDPTAAIKQRLQQALQHFQDAAAARPGDRDARAGAQRAARLLREIEQQQQEQQQEQESQDQKNEQQPQDPDQKQQDGQKGDKGDSEQTQPQEPGQEPPGQKPSDQKPSDQKQEGEQKPPQKPDGTPGQEPKEKPDDTSQGSPKDQKKEGDKPQPQPQPQPGDPQPPRPGDATPQEGAGGAASGEVREIPLSKEQVDRLLQAVRDREKARRARLDAQRPQRSAPAAKDW